MNINKLKKIMKSKKITQTDIANLLNIKQASVSAMFSRQDMNVSQLEKISDFLGVSPVVFFEDVEHDENIINILKIENNMLKQQLADKQKIIELLEKKK